MNKDDNSKALESEPGDGISRWELGALVAAIIILASPFIYVLRGEYSIQLPEVAEAQFAGSVKCAPCHTAAYDKWQDSHHDLAMDKATDESVLGDFADAVFIDPYNGKTSRFFRENDKFLVETEGPDGLPGIFHISHVFGVFPLQQCLVPFPGGRLQCLNIAWDIKASKWYRLPPYDVKGPDDWLHWTKGAQTWNGMCAECHSTRLEKNFKINTDSYETTWFEIDVGCEACHGAGSEHIKWAEQPPLARPKIDNYGLEVKTGNQKNEKQVVICAPCHSRRFQLGDNDHGQGELLDRMVPTLLEEGLYYPDGQIQDEVYVYGSFTQSKMYQHGVRCSDCHDIHSLKLHREGNDLCLQCHRAEDFDTPLHHFHKREHEGKPSEGFLCVKCHMPGRYYMGIDYRPDHSLRIPRPDLSQRLDVPNACSAQGCHDNKSLDWNIEHYTKWYGESRKPHYGEVFAAARERSPETGPGLIRLVNDGLLPVIVRATALSLLRNYPGEESLTTFKKALRDPEALIRYTAIRNTESLGQETVLKLIAPKLYDEVRAVRMEAAIRLASIPDNLIRENDRQTLRLGLEEYRQAMLYNADFAPQRYNLGNMALVQGDPDKAIAYFEQAIIIDDMFYPAKVNLAMHLNQSGENGKAESLLRQVVDQHPRLYEVSYSLGLLLAETNNFREAAEYLGQAADGMPHYSRARYNQALALLKLRRWEEGAKVLDKAVRAEPGNQEYFVTLVNLYLSTGQSDKALLLADRVLKTVPDHPAAIELQSTLKK